MLAEELKSSTKELHNSLESGPFQNSLASADLSLDHYAGYLSQLYLIHQQLEESLSKCKEFSEWHCETAFLAEDLNALGIVTNKIIAVPSTSELLQKIKSAKLPGLLGFYYVLFGSKHGGKFMAAGYRKRDVPCKYFDPYGADFTGMWQRFKGALDTQSLTEDDKALSIQAAKDMFIAIGKMCTEIA